MTGSCGYTLGDTHSPRGLASLLFKHSQGIEIYRRFMAEGVPANDPIAMQIELYIRAVVGDRQDWIEALRPAALVKMDRGSFHESVLARASYREDYTADFIRRWWQRGCPAALAYNEAIGHGFYDLMGEIAASGDLPPASACARSVDRCMGLHFGEHHDRVSTMSGAAGRRAQRYGMRGDRIEPPSRAGYIFAAPRGRHR